MSLLLPRALHCYSRCLRAPQSPRNPLRQAAAYSTSAPPPPRTSQALKLAGAATLAALLAGLYHATSDTAPTTLNPATFTPYTLTTKTPVAGGPTPTSIFTLTPTHPTAAPPPLPLSAGILSLQIKQPQLQIARSYTPLPPPPPPHDDGRRSIRLLIKKEPGGEMSRYLYGLGEGSTVELRGPQMDYEYTASDRSGERKVVFFAGGTGIAPALQVAASLLGEGEGEGKGRGRAEILWAVRRREETTGAMGEEVARLLGRLDPERVGRCVVRVYVDSDGGIRARDVESAIEGRSKVFVSGPEGFIGWIAGPKDFRDGREEQGALGGMIGSALREKGGDVEVFKL